MKKIYGKDCLMGAAIGFLFYIMNLLVSLLSYLPISDALFIFAFIVLILSGCLLMVFLLLYKKPSWRSKWIRLGLSIVSYVLVVIVATYCRLFLFACQAAGISSSPGSDGVSGLMSLTFMVMLFLACVLTLLVIAIVGGVRRMLYKKNRE